MRANDCVPALRAANFTLMVDWAGLNSARVGRTCRDLWDAIPRPDWLLKYAEAAGVPRPALVRAAAACVRPALRFVREGEDRPRLAVEAAEAWADEPTGRNRQRAAKAAGAAWVAEAGEALWVAGDAGKRAAGEAAWSASMAAGAAWSGAGWVSKAAEAARHAAWAHDRGEGPESRAAAQAACAEEVRRIVPFRDLAARR